MSEEIIEAFARRWGLGEQARLQLAELLHNEATAGTFAATDANVTVTIADEEGDDTREIDDPTIRTRYEMLDQIGRGGFGTVHRVHDHHLNRTMAMKVLREKLQGNPDQRRRFLVEAQVTAQLQHPGVLPVHDLGHLDDGRLYYTMKEVQGRTLSSIMSEIHEGDDTEWTLRRAVGVLHRAAEAMGYAHARNVLHRDVKPTNIMVGDHGEVHVVDWGLASVRGAPEPRGGSISDDTSSVVTTLESRAGSVVGTVAYMAPEQARGRTTQLGPHTDVWALGSVLFELLAGRRAYDTDVVADLLGLLSEEPPSVAVVAGRPVPEDLAQIAERAMALDPAERYVDAAAFSRALRRWLDGELRREQAMELVGKAHDSRPEVDALRARVRALQAEVAALSATVAPAAPVEDKKPIWKREDEAAAIEMEANRRELDVVKLLWGALNYDPHLPEAHAELASLYHRRHVEAESLNLAADAERYAQLLSWHDRGGQYAAYLEGRGTLTLQADHPDATATLYRFEEIDRRLQPVLDQTLSLPIESLELPRGSYLVEMSAPGRAPVKVPVAIRRLSDWTGRTPEGEVLAVHLPEVLDDQEVYVPAGPWETGDPVAFSALPAGEAWQEGFVIQRQPVDNAAYKVFLDALVDAGRESDALRCAPQVVTEGAASSILWSRDEHGHFVLPEASLPDAPVVWIDWFCAKAYAAWFAEHTGQPWRLPGDLEWEKAARGVDGRVYPMGDILDPTWARVKASAPEGPSIVSNEAYPQDESPYGVRGLGGNVMNWCEEAFTPSGPPLPGRHGAPTPVTDSTPTTEHILRGGFWWCEARDARSGLRLPRPASFRFDCVGFRLARSITSP